MTATVSAKATNGATANAEGAGIGGSYSNNGFFAGVITIKGGDVTSTVTATPNPSEEWNYAVGAGIGDGYRRPGIAGHEGGKVFIEGGKIKASSYLGAGIGGSSCGDTNGGGWGDDGGTIKITGGTVEATSFYGGAGIGAGYSSDGGTIIISGGEVTATGGKEDGGAGIGGGGRLYNAASSYGGGSGNITITGGSVKAKGGTGASGIGIGHGGTGSPNYSEKKLEISGGTVEATGGDGGAGICIATVEISDTATQPIFAFGGEPDGSGTKGIDGTLNLSASSPLHVMKGTTKDGPWSEREYVSQLPDRFVRLTPYYYITFNGNGGSGKMPAQSNIEYADVTLAQNAFTREYYNFTGWNTKADGSGTSYEDEAIVELTGDLTLYAQWEKVKATITYDPNGGTGEMPPQTYEAGTTVILAENKFARESYTFTGWNTEADGSGESYGDKASFTLGSNLTLYAQWKENEEPTPDDPGEPAEITSINTDYNQKTDVKSILLPRYNRLHPEVVVKKIKFKSSNKKVVKVTKKGIAKGGKRTGTAAITMYVKTPVIVVNSRGIQKSRLSKWIEAGELTVNNTGKPSSK
ncbi:MAG: InlB B-repeat-containing protein [Lachnospiraceae bacterium]|nr:InlB B-repeat-containing protein [Lachnospiraceae bacterium]